MEMLLAIMVISVCVCVCLCWMKPNLVVFFKPVPFLDFKAGKLISVLEAAANKTHFTRLSLDTLSSHDEQL